MGDKWTRDSWLSATLVESYLDAEDVTITAAVALVNQSGIANALANSGLLHILDNGSAMGQITDTLLGLDDFSTSSVSITAGDVNDSILDHLRNKQVLGAWPKAIDVRHMDATDMPGVNDSSYDFILANFLFFLTSDPVGALAESFRTLTPGGTLSFTTWSSSGPFALLQLAQARMPDYPLAPPSSRLLGNWNHPRYVRDQLQQLGYTDISVEPLPISHSAATPRAFAKKMGHVLTLHTAGWGDERQDKGWALGQSIEGVLREQQGEGRVTIHSVVLLITAKRPVDAE